MTPMQEQYNRIKSENPGTVILFRLGDFYETFDSDAEIVSRVLGITLTSRGKEENRQPLAGIPYHALPNYMPKLVEAGLRVAIAEQIEEPVPGKLVERKITKVITPGTVIDENSLDASKNNYISSVYISYEGNKNHYILVFCDLTTGELKGFTTNNAIILKNEIKKVNPAEIIYSSIQTDAIKALELEKTEPYDDKNFDFKKNYQNLISQFNVQNLKGFGIEPSSEKDLKNIGIITATGGLINYLIECQRGDVKHIRGIRMYDYSDYMRLDYETIRNLELLFTMSGEDSPTLYSVLNKCQSPMGKRKLRQWILNPLTNTEFIEERLNSVDFFFSNPRVSSEIRDRLNKIADIERIVGRIGVGSANPKDIVGLKNSLNAATEICTLLENESIPIRVKVLTDRLKSNELNEVVKIISESIDDEPAALINQGGILREGFNTEVDELRSLRSNSKQILAEIQKREIERTNITSLKISFNQVFGYYIEVTRTHLDKVPTDYIRKQTLANAERYITQELKELEEKILSAEEKLIKLEMELYIQIRERLADFSQALLEVGESLAELDVLSDFGFIAREYKYAKPSIIKDGMNIADGRHPVVERLVERFVPNSTEFSCNIHILTGPNMSGKSTYIRQAALIVIMAQIGSFVPASKMEFAPIDRVFTRVGASDNLSRGESTFMVEMNETANILNNATNKSLIILDEVGRGTSTYDGVAIAWSIVEFLSEKIKAYTLFATHYHELTALSDKYKGIKNYNVKVVEDDKGEILFTHHIEEGSTSRSYGVHVAKLAGVPSEVVDRANEILGKFEKENKKEVNDKQDTKKSPKIPKRIHPEQMGLI